MKIGDTLCIYTHIERVGRTSMTLKVEAWAQRYLSHLMEKVTDAEFVMVALDKEGRPTAGAGRVASCQHLHASFRHCRVEARRVRVR